MNTYDEQTAGLGARLKDARIAQGLSIAQLSEQAGIAMGQVHKLENNKVKKVNPAHLAAVAGPLRVPVHELFRLAGYPTEQLPGLEPELTRRLAALSPQALSQITAMLDGWLTQHETGTHLVVEPVPVDNTTTAASGTDE